MTYVRTDTPDFSVPLSRAELRIFTAIRGETSFDTIMEKTNLGHRLVEDTLAALVARGLVRVAGGATQAQLVPPAPQSARWLEQRSAIEDFLVSRIGSSKAESYLAPLRASSNEQAFVETTRSLAKRLALIVDADIGEELLAFLDR